MRSFLFECKLSSIRISISYLLDKMAKTVENWNMLIFYHFLLRFVSSIVCYYWSLYKPWFNYCLTHLCIYLACYVLMICAQIILYIGYNEFGLKQWIWIGITMHPLSFLIDRKIGFNSVHLVQLISRVYFRSKYCTITTTKDTWNLSHYMYHLSTNHISNTIFLN